jgi:hypothetical protein
MITLVMFRNLLSMKWDAVSLDAAATGWLGNPNLFGSCDKEATNNLNTRMVLLLGGKTAVSNHDTQVILKMVVIPPVGVNLIDHLRRLQGAHIPCMGLDPYQEV